MTGERLEVFALEGFGEIVPGDDLVTMIVEASTGHVQSGDVLVVTQKIVSKAEGRMVDVDPDDPLSHKPLVLEESVRVLRRRGELIISETSHGFVCANAGIDRSNVADGQVALLPIDSDRSARRIQDVMRARLDVEIAVIISDTFGRPWRRGVTDVAIGSAGIQPVADLRGLPDATGRIMQVTEVCVADEIAAAADLILGKSKNLPVAVVRGCDPAWFGQGSVRQDIIRDPKDDLFR